MVKQRRENFLFSGPDSTTIFVFEVENNPQRHCGKPTDIYATKHDSLYLAIMGGGFDLRSGRKFGRERNGATQLLQFIAPTENNGYAELYAYDRKTHVPQNK